MSYGSDRSKMNWIIEVDNVIREELRLSEYVMMWCKPIKDSLSLFQLTSKININNFFFFGNFHAKLWTQLKHGSTYSNIIQYICLIFFFYFYLFDFSWSSCFGFIGCNSFREIDDEVAVFGELIVCSGAILPGNLVVVAILL